MGILTFRSRCPGRSLVTFFTLYLRPSVSRECRAIRRDAVNVLTDIGAGGFSAIRRETRAVIRVFYMKVGTNTVCPGWTLDSLVAFRTLRTL